MSLQFKNIYILDMHFSGQVSDMEFEQWLSEIERLILKAQYFCLIMKTEEETTFPADYRTRQSVWLKKNKLKFRTYCIGLARIAQHEEDAIRLNTPALHVAWQVPYFVTCKHTDALNWAIQRWIWKT